MKNLIHTVNIFRTDDNELLKKSVTEKVQNLVNKQIKKND